MSMHIVPPNVWKVERDKLIWIYTGGPARRAMQGLQHQLHRGEKSHKMAENRFFEEGCFCLTGRNWFVCSPIYTAGQPGSESSSNAEGTSRKSSGNYTQFQFGGRVGHVGVREVLHGLWQDVRLVKKLHFQGIWKRNWRSEKVFSRQEKESK